MKDTGDRSFLDASTGMIKTHDMTVVGLIVGLLGIAVSYGVLLLFPF